MEKQDGRQIIEMLARIDADRKAHQEDLLARMDANYKMIARMDAWSTNMKYSRE
jgi:hypothetical protein